MTKNEQKIVAAPKSSQALEKPSHENKSSKPLRAIKGTGTPSMTLVRNKIKFVYFILLQVTPEDRRKLEVEVVVVMNNSEVLVLALFKLGFFNAQFQEILKNDHIVVRCQRRWGGGW